MDTSLVPSKWSASPEFKKQIAGIWLLPIFLVTLLLSTTLGLQLSQALFIEGQPNNPPWYFIRQDFIRGLCDAVALLFSVTLGLVTWERYRICASMLIWLSVLYFGGKVWQVLVIFHRCDFVLDRRLAQTQWTSFESYLYDPLIWYGQLGIAVSAVGLAWTFAWYERKRQRSQSQI
ncbi:MAG TPA: hypothetical protein PLB32_22200 [Acidobacteriota bacterium]|nr:hypothetical protein [Acidobacteriota bacterium]